MFLMSHNASEIKASIIWDSIRQKGPALFWRKLVWHKLLVPRYSFILWMALQGGIRTADILRNYGLEINPICRLYKLHTETFDHVYFNCSYSFQLLHKVMRFCGWQSFTRRWNHFIDFLRGLLAPRTSVRVASSSLVLQLLFISYGENGILDGTSKWNTRPSNDIINVIKCKLHSSLKFQKLCSTANLRHLLL